MNGSHRDAFTLGTALEGDLDAAERRRRGRHFTAPAVARLMARYAVGDGAGPGGVGDARSRSVLDPACGAGILLEACARAGAPVLVGVDRDGDAANASRAILGPHPATATIHRADFLGLEPADLGAPFDAVVVNPPFLRQESIAPALKRTLRRRHPILREPGAGRVDLLGYFLLHLTSFLAPGGRLAFLSSAAWLTSVYGRVIRRFLLEHYRVDQVIESVAEPWFRNARTRAVLVLARRRRGADVSSHPLHFLRLESPLDDAPSLPRGRVVPAAALAAGAPWGAHLRTPPLLEELRHRLPDAWVPLGRCARARFGIKSGADRFFVLRDGVDGHGWRWPGPAAALRPVVMSPTDLRRLDVTPEELPRRMLVLRPDATRDPLVADHVARAEAPPHELHRRPTCRARERADGTSRWYCVAPDPPAPLLWSRTVQYRHLVAANRGRALVNNNLIGLWPRDGVDAEALLASLNSAWVYLERYARGRVSNEGKIKTEVGDLRDLMVPDPALLGGVAVDDLRGHDVGAIDDELERPERQRFERRVLRALGLTDGDELERWVRRLAGAVGHLTAQERRWERTYHRERRRG